MNNADRLPEEQDPQFEELIKLLEHADFIDPGEQSQIIANARDRLFPLEHEISQPGIDVLGSFPSQPKARSGKHGKLIQLTNVIAATLVVVVLIGSALLLFRKPQQPAQAPPTTKAVLTRIDKGPILPGESIVLHGEGFSPHGLISILFDGSPLPLDQSRQLTSSLITANAEGAFTITIVISSNLPWNPGPHVISAEEAGTKLTAKVTVDLSPAPISRPIPQ